MIDESIFDEPSPDQIRTSAGDMQSRMITHHSTMDEAMDEAIGLMSVAAVKGCVIMRLCISPADVRIWSGDGSSKIDSSIMLLNSVDLVDQFGSAVI